MARLRLLIQMQSADAYALKAQALNDDPRLKEAGISALKFTGDRHYIADGEFSPDLTPPETPGPDPVESDTVPAPAGRLRVVIRMANEESYELKAQALNNDPGLREAGISALKFVGDNRYLVDGSFSSDLPSPTQTARDVEKSALASTLGKKLRVVLRMVNTDAYELKAQALNNNPRLKEAGVSALKFAGDSQYVTEGEFSQNLPSPSTPGKKLRVVLRAVPDMAYDLVSKHLNGDPALAKAGITGVGLAKGARMVPVPKEAPQPQPAPALTVTPTPLKKKRTFAGCLVALLIAGFVAVTGAGALFFLPGILNPPAAPVATTAAVVPITGPQTPTDTSLPPTTTDPPPTVTKPASTRTQRPTATNTDPPTVQVVSCQPPKLGSLPSGNANCRYGPGGSYLYEYGLFQGDQVPVLGRADTVFGTWVYVQTESEANIACWVNAELLEMDGDVGCLEDIYPETGGRPTFFTDFFPAPSNVTASRSDNTVFISWTGYELALGDRESENSPRYLLELWTCQGGKIVFSPLGVFEEFASVVDEGGCSEASRGQVYLAHKDGYIGPSEIPWPP